MIRDKKKTVRTQTQSGHGVRAWHAGIGENTDRPKPGKKRGNRMKYGGKRYDGCVNHHDGRSRSRQIRRKLKGIVDNGHV